MKILRKLSWLLLILPSLALAQNYTAVTATNIQKDGGALASGRLCFLATDSSDNPIPFQIGGGGQQVVYPFCAAITTGAIGVGALSVPNPALTAPANINYRVTVSDNIRVLLTYTGVQFTGATFNFDNYIPSAGFPVGVSADTLTIRQLNVTGSCLGCVNGYTIIQNAGTALASHNTLNFFGGIACVDNGGPQKTECQVDTSSSFNPNWNGNHSFLGNTNIAGGFKIAGDAPLGKIPIGNGTNYVPGDPLVQGTQTEGSTAAANPVNVGGYDKAGTPALHGVNVVNGAPAGTEYGVVTRPIPSGTQAVSASSLPLPTNASQEHTTAASPSATRLSDGAAFYKPTTPTDTQPISAAALPLPTGAATLAKQPALGVAGTPSVDVITIQGATSMTPLKTDGSATTQPISGTVTTTPPANASTDVTRFGGNAVATGTGASGVGIPRVTISNDSSLAANQSVNENQVGGSAVSTASAGTQKVGITGSTAAALDFAGQNAASPANSIQIGGQFNTTPTTITPGNSSPLQLDNAGNLLVNIKQGGSSNVQYANPAESTAAWTSATAQNTVLTVTLPSGTGVLGDVVVTLNQGSTITGGQVTFNVSDTTGFTQAYPTNCRQANTSGVANVYALQATTNTSFVCNVAGYQAFQVKLTTAITGSGTVNVGIQSTAAPTDQNVVVTSTTGAPTLGDAVSNSATQVPQTQSGANIYTPTFMYGYAAGLGTWSRVRLDNTGTPYTATGNLGHSDGISNSQTAPFANTGGAIYYPTYGYGFNGSTWDRLKTAAGGPNIANTGILATSNYAFYPGTTPGTITSGNYSPLGLDVYGNLRTTGSYTAESTAVWSSATSINSNVVISTNGYNSILVMLSQGSTITGGQVSFFISDAVAFSNAYPDTCQQVNTSITGTVYTLVQSTNQAFICPLGGAQAFMLKLTTVITGTGAVNVGLIPLSTGTLPPSQYDASGNLKVNIQAGGGTGGGPADVGVTTAASETDAARQKVTAALRLLDTAQGAGSQLTAAKGDQTSGLWVNCKAGCASASDTVGASQALTGTGTSASVALAGEQSASFLLLSGNNLVATLVGEYSFDGGTTWNAGFLRQEGGTWVSTSSVGSTVAAFHLFVPGGASNVRVRPSVFTSGSATVQVRATAQPESLPGDDGMVGFTASATNFLKVAGANVTTTAPSYPNGAQNALSLTTAGALRVDGSAVTQPTAQTDQSTGSTPLGANAAVITLPLTGERAAVFQLQSGGTGVYTVTPQCSLDGGTLYNVAGYIQDPLTTALTKTATIASAQATTDYPVLCPPGSSHAQMKVTSYTSGTANWVARATVNNGPNIAFGRASTSAPSLSNNDLAALNFDLSNSALQTDVEPINLTRVCCFNPPQGPLTGSLIKIPFNIAEQPI
jgi:hypothetical protein